MNGKSQHREMIRWQSAERLSMSCQIDGHRQLFSKRKFVISAVVFAVLVDENCNSSRRNFFHNFEIDIIWISRSAYRLQG